MKENGSIQIMTYLAQPDFPHYLFQNIKAIEVE